MLQLLKDAIRFGEKRKELVKTHPQLAKAYEWMRKEALSEYKKRLESKRSVLDFEEWVYKDYLARSSVGQSA